MSKTLNDGRAKLKAAEAALDVRAEELRIYTKTRHNQLLNELEAEEWALRKKYAKMEAEVSDREKNLPTDLLEKEKELEGREKTIMEREALLQPRRERMDEEEKRVKELAVELDEREKRLVVTARKKIRKEERALARKDEKWLNGNVSATLDEREAGLDEREKAVSIERTKVDRERKRLGIDKVTSEELRLMRAETDEIAQNAKAALNHVEDKLKELNDRKAEVDELQRKLTRRLDAVEALMSGNVRDAVEEYL